MSYADMSDTMLKQRLASLREKIVRRNNRIQELNRQRDNLEHAARWVHDELLKRKAK